jgi:DNA-binding CsgD family transcriptional regulator
VRNDGAAATSPIRGIFDGYAADVAATARPVGELAQRVQRLCSAELTGKALREQIVALLRRVLAFDAYNFPLTDPATLVGTSPLADVPMLPWPRLPELIRWRYLSLVCRWDQLIGRDAPATSLLGETGGEPERSPVWQNVQRELGVTDTCVVVFNDRHGCWGLLDLWRTGGSPFSAAELRMLSSLAEPVTAGLRAAVARTFVNSEEQLLPIGPALLVLGPDLDVRTQTEAAASALLRLNPPDEAIPPIPAAAYNIGAALIAAEHGVPIGPVFSRIHLGGSRWVTAKASRLGDDIGVSIEATTSDDRMDLYARACGLSERETQILALLGQGLDTKQVAERLVISEHTATDHVKAVLAKTGARTRQQLLARVIGTTAAS